MFNSTFSVDSSLSTSKVDIAQAQRVASDRFFNPYSNTCPKWNELDATGRPVCLYSMMTETEGCSQPRNRVEIENSLRPVHMNIPPLSAFGIQHNLYLPEDELLQASPSVHQNQYPQFNLNLRGAINNFSLSDHYRSLSGM